MSRRSAAASERIADATLRFLVVAPLRSTQASRTVIPSSCARNAPIKCTA
jgi:hypothetical protein